MPSPPDLRSVLERARASLTPFAQRPAADTVLSALELAISDLTGPSATIAPPERDQEQLLGLLGDDSARQRLMDLLWSAIDTVAQLPTGVIVLDGEGAVRDVSHAALSLAGETPDAVVAALRHLRPAGGEPPPQELQPLTRALRGEVVAGEEWVLRRLDGGLVPVLVSAAPVLAREGVVAGAAAVFQDISPLKELERLRSEWTALIAHDLRHPVQTIELTAEVLARSENEERRRRSALQLQSAVTLLVRMIDDLSVASNIEARQLTVEPRATELRALVLDVAERSAAVTPGLRVLLEPSAVAWAFVDPMRMEQVLANLLSNAAKYGRDGADVLVRIETDGDTVKVAVKNEGSGIPPDELPHVFERFTRTRESRASGKAGLGLGLYICKGLVEAQGGRIWVESTPGETTSFHVVLPGAPGKNGPAG